jgi:hypothetical protein
MKTEDLIRELEATVIEAGQCLRYWRVFNDPKHVKERTRTMNGYPLFFRTARRAFLTTAIVDLYRLYDLRSDTATIHTLRMGVASENALKYPAAVAKADAAIAKARSIWERVRVLRHKLFAHRADAGDSNYWFQQSGISSNALFTLHSLSKQAVKNLSHARDGSSHAFNLEGAYEFDELLKDLGAGALRPRPRFTRPGGRVGAPIET